MMNKIQDETGNHFLDHAVKLNAQILTKFALITFAQYGTFFTRRPGKKRFFWLSISQATRQTKPDHDFTQFVCFVGGFLPSNKLI